jgi:hypothetical protein
MKRLAMPATFCISTPAIHRRRIFCPKRREWVKVTWDIMDEFPSLSLYTLRWNTPLSFADQELDSDENDSGKRILII